MANGNFKIEGGQGGRRGHSNMEHWDRTEEIKAATRWLRRAQSKNLIRWELDIYYTDRSISDVR